MYRLIYTKYIMCKEFADLAEINEFNYSHWLSTVETFSMKNSVMQPDRNSFCDGVVMDSANMALRDEDNHSDQIYEKQINIFRFL